MNIQLEKEENIEDISENKVPTVSKPQVSEIYLHEKGKSQYETRPTPLPSSSTSRESDVNVEWYRRRIKSLPDKKGTKYEKEVAYYKKVCMLDAFWVVLAPTSIKGTYYGIMMDLHLGNTFAAERRKKKIKEDEERVSKWVSNMLELANVYFLSGDRQSAVRVCDILINCPYTKWDSTLVNRMPEVLKSKRKFLESKE